MKETQLTDSYNRIVKLKNMNTEGSSNVQYQKLQLEDSIFKEKYPILEYYSIFSNYLNNIPKQIYCP